MRTNRVLLSHRDAAVQDLAARALSLMSVTLDVPKDRDEAFSLVARETYSVIAMERDDALLSAIGASRAASQPVVIVMTAEKEDLDASVVSLVVPEPFDPQVVVGVIIACVAPDNLSSPPEPDLRAENTGA